MTDVQSVASGIGKALRGPFGLVLALLGLSGILYGARSQSSALANPEPPGLFGAPEGCSATPSPLHRASELEARARAYMQRYPFEAVEGVRAVQSLAQAEQCFERAERRQDESRVRVQAEAYRHRVQRDYAGHQLRLHRALLSARTRDAALEGRALLALLAGQEGPYVAWLRRVERDAQ